MPIPWLIGAAVVAAAAAVAKAVSDDSSSSSYDDEYEQRRQQEREAERSRKRSALVGKIAGIERETPAAAYEGLQSAAKALSGRQVSLRQNISPDEFFEIFSRSGGDSDSAYANMLKLALGKNAAGQELKNNELSSLMSGVVALKHASAGAGLVMNNDDMAAYHSLRNSLGRLERLQELNDAVRRI